MYKLDCKTILIWLTSRCFCRNCSNGNDKKENPKVTRKGKGITSDSGGKVPRLKGDATYEMAGLSPVTFRWSLEETLLLFLIIETKTKKYTIATIVTEYNETSSSDNLKDLRLSQKTKNQITSKIKNLKEYMNIYCHKENKEPPQVLKKCPKKSKVQSQPKKNK